MLHSIHSNVALQSVAQAAAASGTPLFTIEMEEPYDAKAFYDAVIRALPLDPPIMMAGDKLAWDALSDSLFGGLSALGAKRVVIVWRNHGEMKRINPESYKIALSVLEQVQEELGSDEATAGSRQVVEIYLASNE